MEERIEEIGFGGLKLVQDPAGFCYGVDAVILADFANSIYPGFQKVIDLGTGTGVIPFILSHKNPRARMIGIDIQKRSIELANKSCAFNHLTDRISFYQADVSRIEECGIERGCADMVICNPPYFAKGGAVPSSAPGKFIARHETTATVEDFIKAAAMVLSDRGHFFMIHRPSRLVDIFVYCRKYALEPKDMRLVVPKPGETSNLVLLHCTAGGGRQLALMEELSVYQEDGRYSDEIEAIYERKPQGIKQG